MKKFSFHRGGFTTLEILIVLAVIGVLLAIAVPNVVRSRTSAYKDTCIGNLGQIDAAKSTWATAMRSDPSAVPTASQIQPFLARGSVGTLPFCPADTSKSFATSYSINAVRTLPTCLILGNATNQPHVLQ